MEKLVEHDKKIEAIKSQAKLDVNTIEEIQ